MRIPELIQHVGWDLHQSFALWKDRFNQKMVDRGCGWMAEARGALLQHIGPQGIAQNRLVQKTGLTKQAVQQHLDALVLDGVIERVNDTRDARQKRIQLTRKGYEAADIANQIKTEIEAEFRSLTGEAEFDVMTAALRAIAGAGST